MDNLNSRETAQNDSPLRRLISHIFGGMSQGTPNPPRTGSLPPEVVDRGRTAMADTMMAAQNSQAAGAPPMPMPPTDAMADEMDLGRRNLIGMQNTPSRQQSAQSAQSPELAMYGSPITEGADAGDPRNADSRERALAMIAALRNGGGA